jgi:hypothetical protein
LRVSQKGDKERDNATQGNKKMIGEEIEEEEGRKRD